jgi:hypothetical protein
MVIAGHALRLSAPKNRDAQNQQGHADAIAILERTQYRMATGGLGRVSGDRC